MILTPQVDPQRRQEHPWFTLPRIHRAYRECRQGKRSTHNALAFEVDLETNLIDLRDELQQGTWRPRPSLAFLVERPKRREIFAADFRDRIVHHLLVGQLTPVWERRFIHDSFACRPGSVDRGRRASRSQATTAGHGPPLVAHHISPCPGVPMNCLCAIPLLLTLLTRPGLLAAAEPAPAAPPASTGQTTSYAADDDGALKHGVVWPSPRFTDNSNGTVTDSLTKLIWLKQANYNSTAGTTGTSTWATAMTFCNTLATGQCGLTDGSTAGQWRLPSVRELSSLIDAGKSSPALPAGHPFVSVQSSYYWSGTSDAGNTGRALIVYLNDGYVVTDVRTSTYSVWPVRGGP